MAARTVAGVAARDVEDGPEERLFRFFVRDPGRGLAMQSGLEHWQYGVYSEKSVLRPAHPEWVQVRTVVGNNNKSHGSSRAGGAVPRDYRASRARRPDDRGPPRFAAEHSSSPFSPDAGMQGKPGKAGEAVSDFSPRIVAMVMVSGERCEPGVESVGTVGYNAEIHREVAESGGSRRCPKHGK